MTLFNPIKTTFNEKTESLAKNIIISAIAIHRTIGADIRKNIYVECLAHELELRGFQVQKEVIFNNEKHSESQVVLELLVENEIAVLCISEECVQKKDVIALLNQMKHTDLKLGLIFNFNVKYIRSSSIRRVINVFVESDI